MKFTNINIGKRLTITFGIITLLILSLLFMSYQAINGLSNRWEQFHTGSLEKYTAAYKGEADLGDGIHMFKDYLLRGKEEYNQQFMADMAAIDLDAANYANKHGNMNERERVALQQIKESTDAYRAAMNQVVEMKKSGATIEKIDKSVKGADRPLGKAFNDLLAVVQEETDATAQSVSSTANSSKRETAVIGVLALVLSALFAWIITRGLLKQLGGEPAAVAELARSIANGKLDRAITIKEGDGDSLMLAMKTMQDNLQAIIDSDLGRVLDALSRGDLTEKISNDYPGVFGQLKDDANTTVEKLTEIIAQVKNSTELITAASQEIAQGNSDLSQRTTEQASSLEETASSMEELTSTVKQNAENAKHANQLSMSASDIAVKGGKMVGDVVDTMASISASSRKIIDIISVIEGIAFQTNILALNAAVEAARAGEQGRGFAVVASEVRSLAQRSAAAAKEIKHLIDDSVGKVDTGSKQVDLAGATMNEIVIAVKRVTDIMSEISAASSEQSAGIEQVNQAITQMDTVTQQNAALVEEAAAAADSMQEQATALDVAMGTFKLEERMGGTAVAKPVAQPQKAIAMPRKELKLPKVKANKDGDWKEF
jgi:methyl-accepting chemotaxis protein